METLKEHNEKKRASMFNLNNPHPNGIECPKCKKELWDSNPMEVLTSYPPQTAVHCPDPECGYKGTRVA